jgi:hypothetical protein
MGSTQDLDKILVDELWCDLEEELPDVGHRIFTRVVIRSRPVAKSHLRMASCSQHEIGGRLRKDKRKAPTYLDRNKFIVGARIYDSIIF